MDREEYLESVTMNTGIKMNSVESSNIEGIGYDNNNKVYRYDLVPRKTFEELMNAESKGRYLNYHIKGQYEATRYELKN